MHTFAPFPLLLLRRSMCLCFFFRVCKQFQFLLIIFFLSLSLSLFFSNSFLLVHIRCVAFISHEFGRNLSHVCCSILPYFTLKRGLMSLCMRMFCSVFLVYFEHFSVIATTIVAWMQLMLWRITVCCCCLRCCFFFLFFKFCT